MANDIDLLLFKDGIGNSFVAGAGKIGSEKGHKRSCIRVGVYLVWEPRNIPARDSSIVLHHDLQVGEFSNSDRVECYVEKNESPLEESVDCVC